MSVRVRMAMIVIAGALLGLAHLFPRALRAWSPQDAVDVAWLEGDWARNRSYHALVRPLVFDAHALAWYGGALDVYGGMISQSLDPWGVPWVVPPKGEHDSDFPEYSAGPNGVDETLLFPAAERSSDPDWWVRREAPRGDDLRPYSYRPMYSPPPGRALALWTLKPAAVAVAGILAWTALVPWRRRQRLWSSAVNVLATSSVPVAIACWFGARSATEPHVLALLPPISPRVVSAEVALCGSLGLLALITALALGRSNPTHAADHAA